ncbi:hypothetical protein [Stenotrophomonas sp.]|uniref:hypothetical protein n=1 Tax=Stenotrophomonas sp. TaxID=69392 RepID=UPI00374D32A9
MLTHLTTAAVYRFLRRYHDLRSAAPDGVATDLSGMARQLVAAQQSTQLICGLLDLDRTSAEAEIADRARWLITTLRGVITQRVLFDAAPPCIVLETRHIETTRITVQRILLDCLALALLTTLDDGATLISVALYPDRGQQQAQLRIESDRPGLAFHPQLCASIQTVLQRHGGQLAVQAGSHHQADEHEHWTVAVTMPLHGVITPRTADPITPHPNAFLPVTTLGARA